MLAVDYISWNSSSKEYWTDHRNRRMQGSSMSPDCINAEKLHNLFTSFTDHAFDMVRRDGFWKIIERFWCPHKFTFHLVVASQDDGHRPQQWRGIQDLSIGVKQGWMLLLTLFCMNFPAMMMDAFHNCREGLAIRYWMDGKMFNLWPLLSSE